MSERTTRLRGSFWLRAAAFVLAWISGVTLCMGAGGLFYLADSFRYNGAFLDSPTYYSMRHDMDSLLEEYLFLSSHSGALTPAGRERLGQLMDRFRRQETNYRFLILDERGERYLYNAGEEDWEAGIENGQETASSSDWQVSAYGISAQRNIGYYLDLSRTEDWTACLGSSQDFARTEFASGYCYNIGDYLDMLEEAALGELEGLDRETAAGMPAVMDTSENSPATQQVGRESDSVEEPVDETETIVVDGAVGEETDWLLTLFPQVHYDSITQQYYLLDEERESYEALGDNHFVYYRFDPDREESYHLWSWLDTDFPVEDQFASNARYYAVRQAEAREWIQPVIICALSSLAVFLPLLALLTWGAGWNRKGELALRGLNRMGLELLCLVLLVGVGLLLLGVQLADWLYDGPFFLGSQAPAIYEYLLFFGIAGLVCVPFCLMAWTVLTAQIKTRQLLKRSFCIRLCLRAWKGITGLLSRLLAVLKELVQNRPLYQKVLLWSAGYMVLMLFWYLGIARDIVLNSWNPLVRSFMVLLPAVPVVLLLCKWAMDYNRMRRQVQRLIEGDFDTKLETGRMLPDLRSHGEDLNNLSAGLSRAVEERVKSQRFKTELITNVSHDLKTPLTSIINYVDLLKKADIADETVRGYIEVLDRKSQRLKTLTEDLLEASKAASGTIGVQLEALDVTELCEQAVGEYDERLKQAALSVHIKRPEQPLKVMADGRHLWRILDNLLANCTKYAMAGTRVYLDISRKGKMAVLEMKNISAEALNVPADELMKRFVRGDSARSTEGSGLGLSIARNLTNAQKGEFGLVVDGDLFKAVISLPLAEERE